MTEVIQKHQRSFLYKSELNYFAESVEKDTCIFFILHHTRWLLLNIEKLGDKVYRFECFKISSSRFKISKTLERGRNIAQTGKIFFWIFCSFFRFFLSFLIFFRMVLLIRWRILHVTHHHLYFATLRLGGLKALKKYCTTWEA